MASYQVQLREGLLAAITEASSTYVIDPTLGAGIEETYLPIEQREAIEGKTKVNLLLHSIPSEIRSLRDKTVLLELKIGVEILEGVNVNEIQRQNELLELYEQIKETCKDDELVDDEDFTWIRNDPLLDENELPYSYESLATEGVFRAIFIAVYQYIK